MKSLSLPLRKLSLALTLVLGSLGYADLVWAETDQQRFLRVEAALKAGRPQLFSEEEQALSDYPLLPYLQAQFLQSRLDKVDEKTLGQFLDRYDNTPFASELRSAWLKLLAKTGDAAGFLLFYRDSSDMDLKCRYFGFALEAARSKELLDQFTRFWLDTQALPESCEQAESLWVQAGQRSRERIWEKIEKAIDRDDTKALKLLQNLLPEAEHALLAQWQSLHNRPEQLAQTVDWSANAMANAYMLTDALERLMWRDRDAALQAFELQQAAQRLSAAQLTRVRALFALALATDAHHAAAQWLSQLEAPQLDERMAGWRVMTPLRRLDLQAASKELGRLPASLQDAPRFRYLQARLLVLANTPAAAEQIYRELAIRNDYYGFAARGQLAEPPPLRSAELQIATPTMQKMRKWPALQRTRVWRELDREAMARREWYFMTRQLRPEELQAAAVIAHEWGWSDRALVTIRQAGIDAGWELQYPLVNPDTMKTETRHRDIDLAWAYAISRQESLFIADIRSSAGAIGLMQLMPATAQLTARKFRIPYSGAHQLSQPLTNIRLGVAYLSELLERNGGSLAHATAAYNAGQQRVDRWRARDGALPLDLWIETIPYKETQGYVKNVLAFSQIYSQRLGTPALAFEQWRRGTHPAASAPPATPSASPPASPLPLPTGGVSP